MGHARRITGKKAKSCGTVSSTHRAVWFNRAWVLTLGLEYGGGLKLLGRNLTRPLPNSDARAIPVLQMGGWFIKGNQFLSRFPRAKKCACQVLGGEVLEKNVGASPIKIYRVAKSFHPLQTGTIDATEWVGPFTTTSVLVCYQSGGKYYYYPGWHEPGFLRLRRFSIKEAFSIALPSDLQAIVRSAGFNKQFVLCWASFYGGS